jgi:hypothetical protein
VQPRYQEVEKVEEVVGDKGRRNSQGGRDCGRS